MLELVQAFKTSMENMLIFQLPLISLTTKFHPTVTREDCLTYVPAAGHYYCGERRLQGETGFGAHL